MGLEQEERWKQIIALKESYDNLKDPAQLRNFTIEFFDVFMPDDSRTGPFSDDLIESWMERLSDRFDLSYQKDKPERSDAVDDSSSNSDA